ncbi:unnamed protein product [Brassica rapa subsp. narinosa]
MVSHQDAENETTNRNCRLSYTDRKAESPDRDRATPYPYTERAVFTTQRAEFSDHQAVHSQRQESTTI